MMQSVHRAAEKLFRGCGAAYAGTQCGYRMQNHMHVLRTCRAHIDVRGRHSPVKMAGFVKLEGLPMPVAEGGRAAADAGAPASLSSELVSLEGRRGLLRGTSCSASVEQVPTAQTCTHQHRVVHRA